MREPMTKGRLSAQSDGQAICTAGAWGSGDEEVLARWLRHIRLMVFVPV